VLRIGLEGVWGRVVSEARRADVKFFRGGTHPESQPDGSLSSYAEPVRWCA